MRLAVVFIAISIFLLSASAVFAQDLDCDLAHQEACGDFNNNGVVDVADLIRLIGIFEGNIELDSLPKYSEDLDCDCDNLHLTVADMITIGRRLIHGLSGWRRGSQLYSESDFISIPPMEASPGEELDIPVYISTERDLLGLQFYISYSAEILEITDFESSESLPAFMRIFEGGVGVASILPYDNEFDGFAGNLRAIVSPDTPIGSEILLAFSNDPHKILYTGLVDSIYLDQSRIIELHFIHPVKIHGIINVVDKVILPK